MILNLPMKKDKKNGRFDGTAVLIGLECRTRIIREIYKYCFEEFFKETVWR